MAENWGRKVTKLFPWGVEFAERRYTEFGYYPEEAQWVAKYLRSPARILVIGSGSGREAVPIHQDGHTIICVDIGEMYLRSGRRWFAHRNARSVYFVQGDMRWLPFAAHSFDFVFFSMYSYMGQNRMNVLQDIHRLLRPGGMVLLATWTPRYAEELTAAGIRLPPDATTYTSDQQVAEDLAASPVPFDFLDSAVETTRHWLRFSVLRKP